MKFVILIFLCIFNHALAQTMTSTIVDISHDEDVTRIYLENGAVLKANKSLHGIDIGHTYKFHFKTDRIITLISAVNFSSQFNEIPLEIKSYSDLFQTYFPTIIPNLQRGHELFSELETKTNNSECFNRAHVWSYSWRIKHQIYSSKAWIFFTRKYIRKYDFQWWFHVAPMLHISSDEDVIERIADKKYAKRLLTMKEWTDVFMRNKVECPLIDFYSEYANYPETGWCYTMKTNMYYYQPIDLENFERDGKVKNTWNHIEVIQAYKDALEVDI
ncbi:MAG: protein-glutamine glutaminase family protein [Candidatus Caldatribacteriota bacterium]